MSATPPVHAAARPLLDLLSRAVLALLDPIDPSPVRPAPGRVPPRYAAFDTPTYQRRGLRIAGLGDAVDAPEPALSPPRGSTLRTPRPTAPARRAAR
ncbi:MAG: hypothetical protein ACK54X_14440 [Burkholderiales bacterium]|jgi:hypothetical protein